MTTLYLTRAPKEIPIGTATGVQNPDGSITIVSGGALFASAAAMNRTLAIDLIDGDADVEISRSDFPTMAGEVIKAAVMAERVNAAVRADNRRGGMAGVSYSAYTVEPLTGAIAETRVLTGGPGHDIRPKSID